MRALSKAINELLTGVLFRPRKEVFGSLKRFSLDDLEIEDKEFE